VAFAVANRHMVPVSFDPFASSVDGAEITAPLFVLLTLAMMSGVVVGGLVTWIAQGRFRRALREARREAANWRNQAERLQAAPVSSVSKLPTEKDRSATKASTRLLAHS
jgi:lipopolysaccharide assembly LapA-like protein